VPVALITGSSRGIGAATAAVLAGRGHDIVVHYRRELTAAEACAATVRRLDRRALVVRAELADEDDVRRLVGAAVEHFGRLDVVVANAASSAFKPLAQLRRHHLQATFDTVIGSFQALMQAAEPHLGAGGRVVTVSGFDTIDVLADHGLLAAAKAALEVLTRYWAVDLAPRGVTVNAVVPGYVDTDSARLYADTSVEGGWEAAHRQWAAQTPMGRVATPEEIANVIALLCSPDAGWITGQLIVADGGLTLR
jgi:enoyl-[acyl-carrier protein] reductase III